MCEIITLKSFSEIDLDDEFFKTLKDDYPGFEDWFHRKSSQKALTQYANGKLQAFLYLKNESCEAPEGIVPRLPPSRWLKVGTFKIDAHNTKLGERFIKKIMDVAIAGRFDGIYVTVFPKQGPLINLLGKYGFEERGKKGNELVLVKDMKRLCGDPLKDYPLFTSVS